MSLRLVLTPSDVARITVQTTLGPFAETLLAYSRLQDWRDLPGSPRARGPARDVRSVATGRDRFLASLLWLSPTVALDLFTVVGRQARFGGSRDALLDAPQEQVAFEGEYWASLRRSARRLGVAGPPAASGSAWLADLSQGSSSSRTALFEHMRDFHARAVGDRWPIIRSQLAAEQSRLERRLVTTGVEGLLSGLGDRVRYHDSALDLPHAGVLSSCHFERALAGRCLAVIPSFFALEPQIYWPEDPAAAVMLIAPVQPVGERPVYPAVASEATKKLLGDTRTAALAAISRRTCSTSELAATLGISVSGASQHASTLRNAGLIVTRRDGRRVLHSVSELGTELLMHA